MTPWLTVIGIGDSGLASLSPQALEALEAARSIFGGRRHLAMLPEALREGRETMPWRSPFEDSLAEIAARRGTPVAVLASGDPFHFGVGGTLAQRIPAAEMIVFPSPSSLSLAAARLGWPLESCEIRTVHGRPLERLAEAFAPDTRLLVLSENGASPAAIAALLAEQGFGNSRLTVLEHLGGPRERIRAATASAFDLGGIADLNLVAVDCLPAAGHVHRPRLPGLADEAFRHDGKMTKRVLRALALAALAPRPGELLWDIGAGSGAIAVEWARAARNAAALAIEPRADRCAMIERNRRVLAAPLVRIVEGRAPEALAGLAPPDAVFIGGGLSEGVFAPVFSALKPGGRLVAHAVTLESEAILLGLHAELGGTLQRVSVETAEPVGPFRGWRAAMPVLHWHLVKEGA